jgi:hypothetical protein
MFVTDFESKDLSCLRLINLIHIKFYAVSIFPQLEINIQSKCNKWHSCRSFLGHLMGAVRERTSWYLDPLCLENFEMLLKLEFKSH